MSMEDTPAYYVKSVEKTFDVLRAFAPGHPLLAALPAPELAGYFEAVNLQRFTERSVESLDQLREEVDLARSRGWSMVSQELEEGLRGVAVPVRSGQDTVAAVNVSLQTHRAP